MANWAFKYIDEEPLISEENIDRLKQIFELPIHEAIQLTEDELDEDVDPSLSP
jgi:hypothetical protein